MITPAYEPIIVARKPCECSCIDNVLKYGVGGLNIDECRIPFRDDADYAITANKNQHEKFGTKPMTNNVVYGDYSMVQPKNYESDGRFPANVILTYNEETKAEVIGGMPDTESGIRKPTGGKILNPDDGWNNNSMVDTTVRGFDDSGSAARYFYNAQETERDNEQIIYEVKPMENQNAPKTIQLFSEGNNYALYQGNMLDMLDIIEPNSIDAIVTDPPYELNFMNKGWDNSGVAFQKETWEKCLKVLKPGGYLLAFGGSRTSHRIACAIEDAGFEIRDTIMWLYGAGFPKSMNIAKGIEARETYGKASTVYKRLVEQSGDGEEYSITQTNNGAMGEKYEATRKDYQPESDLAKTWEGWGTCLKPAYEPVLVARKPCEGSCIDNVLTYGTGGINIDECRIPFEDTPNPATNPLYRLQNGYKTTANANIGDGVVAFGTSKNETNVLGRFPANVILTYDETDKEEVCEGMPNSEGCKPHHIYSHVEKYEGWGNITQRNGEIVGYADNGGSAARYFYCAKASKRDRDEGCENLEDKTLAMSNQAKAELKRGNTGFTGDPTSPLNAFNTVQVAKNNHPTVKPVNLMQYLIRLVTPKGGTILDPFNGSGSTGKAAMFENKDRNANYKYIGIELTPEYLPISKARIEYAINYVDVIQEKPMSAEKKKMLNNQISLFDLPQ